MFLARIVFFRLHESPRYLVHAGRPEEAIVSLQMISKFNGSELSLGLEDVADHIHHCHPPPLPNEEIPEDDSRAPFLSHHDHDIEQGSVIVDASSGLQEPVLPSNTIFDAGTDANAFDERGLISNSRTLTTQTSREGLRTPSELLEQKSYQSTSKHHTIFPHIRFPA